MEGVRGSVEGLREVGTRWQSLPGRVFVQQSGSKLTIAWSA